MVAKTKSQSGPYFRLGFFTALTAILIAANVADAARWTLPANESGQVSIVNPSRDLVEVYRKDFQAAPGTVSETASRLPARQTLKMDVSLGLELSVIEIPALSKATVKFTNAQGLAQELGSGQSNHLSFTSQATRNSGELVLTNLSSQSQDGRILSRKPGHEGQELQRVHLGGREVLKLPMTGLSGSAFSIESEFNLQAHIKDGSNLEFATLRLNHRALPAPQGRYFVVANSNRSAAYLVDLTDPAMISEARLQIQEPEIYHPRILVAEIGVNHVGDNRNWDDKTRHPWSWRISVPLRFASLASQACDGHPQQVEDQLKAWLTGDYTGGRPVICFWGYQVVQELP